MLLAAALAGCALDPTQTGARPVSYTRVASDDAALAAAARRAGAHAETGDSGVYLLDDGLSALAARIALIALAESSLDLQYYIFAEDSTSRIIAAMLLEAADRGVRVRLLLDDLGTPVRTPSATALDEHPNVQIRIFNPVAARGGLRRLALQAASFHRINHRMHNKLMIADGTALITGGRNIADEYFSRTSVDFQDIDALVLGAVLPEAARSFDDYWNSPGAVPLQQLLPRGRRTPHLDELRARAPAYLAESADSEFAAALRGSTMARALAEGTLEFTRATVTLLVDPPEKALQHGELPTEAYLGYALREIAARPSERLFITSAYFVPGDTGVALFSDMEQRGVDVRILTNSLASTDVAIVHSGYARYRAPLLRAGVEVWELNTEAGVKQRWFKGESRASLHAKAMLIDDSAAFIGSVNLDARSLVQNTEIGIYVQSAEINRRLSATFERWFSEDYAWQLGLDERGRLTWCGREDETPVTRHREPETTAWQRFKVWLLAWLPVEAQI